MGEINNKLKFSKISKDYDVILINNWIELKQALANKLIIMALIKKVKIKKPGGGNTSGGRKSTEKLLNDFENKINNQLIDFKKEIIIAFKSEITKVNAKIDKVEANINNRLDNIVRLNNLKE